jgi:hypothetical protein
MSAESARPRADSADICRGSAECLDDREVQLLPGGRLGGQGCGILLARASSDSTASAVDSPSMWKNQRTAGPVPEKAPPAGAVRADWPGLLGSGAVHRSSSWFGGHRYPLDANCWCRRLARGPGTVLALPQIWVSARWISCLGPASIERQVTGMADTAGYRRNSDECTR